MKVYVCCQDEKREEQARDLARKLQTEYVCNSRELPKGTLILNWKEQGLCLEDGELSLRGDFTAMLPRIQNHKWQHEILVKAVRIKGTLTQNGRIIDATAGMGEDALLLAAAGYQVTLYEYDPIISALLGDTMDRAHRIPELSKVVERMRFIQGDSITAMQTLKEKVDVVYLDPMFPARHKSGLIKKKFQLLQQIESPCDMETELLHAAIQCAPQRIVIKRPAKGPYMGQRKPDFSFQGKAIRYDCIALPKSSKKEKEICQRDMM